MSLLAPRTPDDYLALGYELTCYCEHEPRLCRHSGRVTMETLALRLGRGFNLSAGRNVLLSRLVCSVCGRRRPTTILSRIAPSEVGPLPHPPVGTGLVSIEEATRRWLELAAQARTREAALGFESPKGRRVRKFGRR